MNPQILGQVKVLTSQCFPVVYKDSFIDSLVHDEKKFIRLAYIRDSLVGIIACKILNSQVYIMLLGVLPAYRCHGIASHLLDLCFDYVDSLSSEVNEIVLHVQTNNETGLEFYKKKKFCITETFPDYYPQLDPSSAFFLVCSTQIPKVV